MSIYLLWDYSRCRVRFSRNHRPVVAISRDGGRRNEAVGGLLIGLGSKIAIEAEAHEGPIAIDHELVDGDVLIEAELVGKAVETPRRVLVNIGVTGRHHPDSIVRKQLEIALEVVRTDDLQRLENEVPDPGVRVCDFRQYRRHRVYPRKKGVNDLTLRQVGFKGLCLYPAPMRTLTTLLLIIAAALAWRPPSSEGDLPKEFVDQKYSNEASRFLTTEDGKRIHYRDQGKGAPIVLIHGSNASLHTWEPWVRILSEHYRVITLDLPGHGLTGQVPDADYSTRANIETIKAVLDHLEMETFVLGGNSMGGGVTWRYALRYPEQVEAMILVDASGLPSWREDETSTDDVGEAPLVFRLLSHSWFRAVARYLDPWMLIEQGLQSAYNNSPVVTEELIDRYYELSLREGTRQATMDRFASFSENAGDEPDLSVLDQPTLVLWGAQDTLIPVATAMRFEEMLPNAHAIVYEHLGHVPMEEAPDRTARDVIRFLKNPEQPGISDNTNENTKDNTKENANET
ncbi:MAG: alpha/beta hydrolase [Gammaproteobacteria bacterium]|nr:alpha/beta hydrolase [Gammaproteobacteria bacterium]